METNIPFELTNEQRKYLGLSPVGDTWELVYFEKQYLYYDGNIIRKKITVNDDGSYYEAELYEVTEENRTILLPKTKRGKPKKMNYTATLSFSPFGVYFMFSNNEIIIANYTTQTTFYHENPQSNISLNDWLKQWISETTEEDLKEIELYKKAKRKHVKYKEGDFFSFKIGRRKWGFGRIVLNIAQLRKSATFMAQKNYGLTHLMGQALYIMIYQTIADTTEIDINGLRQCKTFPVQAIMDNTIYYGEYKIIGNLPVTTDEWEPIISYGRSISGQDKDTVYLQYGMIFKETTIDKFDKYLRIENIINPYRKEKIGFSINSYHILANEMKSLVTVQRKRKSTDLRDPENIEIKREIFSFFGLDADKSYAENLKLVGIND
ncbi:MAG: immunity 26/phosphotriesterase HocA family protein [Bacteroides thetaiotaomicron]